MATLRKLILTKDQAEYLEVVLRNHQNTMFEVPNKEDLAIEKREDELQKQIYDKLLKIT